MSSSKHHTHCIGSCLGMSCYVSVSIWFVYVHATQFSRMWPDIARSKSKKAFATNSMTATMGSEFQLFTPMFIHRKVENCYATIRFNFFCSDERLTISAMTSVMYYQQFWYILIILDWYHLSITASQIAGDRCFPSQRTSNIEGVPLFRRC